LESVDENFLIFKLCLHLLLGRHKIKLSDLFKGAVVDIPTVLDVVIKTPKKLAVSAREIFSAPMFLQDTNEAETGSYIHSPETLFYFDV
jgi:hypothetical protein